MIQMLTARHSHPLEREYEAWIVQGIEEYLTDLGMNFAIWAVSPKVEKLWPADEHLFVNSKIVGLQFKRAKMAAGPADFHKLHWLLHNPPGQFALVKKHREIFYCLPTFIDRSLRSRALDHCLFWRPSSVIDHNVWYDNPAPTREYGKVRNSMRWGRFMEQLLSCTVGIRLNSRKAAFAHLNRIYENAQEFMPDSKDENSIDTNQGLYILVIKLPLQ